MLANETIDGLTGGRLSLTLRGGDAGEGEPEGEALDLRVCDRDTGARPVPVRLVSGSQKFRIAISLALAIGRYSSRDATRVESVIIDEGFGSLDRAGRDSMIQELNQLRQQLSRIILVSHQEEFTDAFTTGYAISLQDGASRVLPIDRVLA